MCTTPIEHTRPLLDSASGKQGQGAHLLRILLRGVHFADDARRPRHVRAHRRRGCLRVRLRPQQRALSLLHECDGIPHIT